MLHYQAAGVGMVVGWAVLSASVRLVLIRLLGCYIKRELNLWRLLIDANRIPIRWFLRFGPELVFHLPVA